MKELNGIPEQDFQGLSRYLGKEKAMEYIKKEKYNYGAVVNKLIFLRLKNYSKRKPIVFWTLLIFLMLLLGYYIFDTIHY
ncbi:hypothetical protein [Sunxiuqinia elliptica]|uniref:Uncharacterized protein n=1 Tax=Sunxiuqinia elliptica TaxID=655355 RepID=A0A4R6GQZ2_9BACT|nr:hypothetical protein [Sunxiuqinia elliptica]TDN97731.1 hypothetical protein DET52_109133 [Sunxiuqinia elliptica]TDO67086.1 hypothetical protein DET65_0455 [Sunxiuqinia elliptica]